MIWLPPEVWISRLGDTELVDALAHDVDRALQGVLRHDRGLGGRLPLVDELHAALEIEAEKRLVRLDDAGDTGDDDDRAAHPHGPITRSKMKP